MRLVKIKDIGTVVSGSTPKTNVPEYWGGEIAWATPKDLSLLDGQYLYDTAKKITQLGYDSCSTSLLPKDSVLFSSRAPIGLVAINKIPVCTNQGFKSIIPNKEVSSLYLYYALKYFSKTLERLGNGATFKELSKKTFEEFALPLPDISDQIRIADILSKAELLIRQRKESLRLLDEFLKSTFLEMFGDPVRNEKGWKKVRLSEICSKIGSGATPRGGKESYKSEGIKLIRSMNVHNNTFIFDGLVFIDEAQASKLDHVIVKPNDVLLNITGASVGRCCLAPKEVVPARVNQHVSIIRPDSNVINPVFLSRVLTNTHFQAQIVKEAKLKGATREAITKEEIERMEVPLPNKRFQSLFATIVEKTELLKARQQHSLKELSTLYGSLSQRAFQGELDLREEPLANAAEPEVVYHKARK
jgi:type I restriction enzyme S subunit